MKTIHLFVIILFSFFLLNVFSTEMHAVEQTILFDGDLWEVSDRCFLNDGITYIEAEVCFEKYGYDYKIENNTLYLNKTDKEIIFNIGHSDYKDNGQYKIMKDTVIQRDKTIYIPLRFFSEINGHDVTWSNETKAIEITSYNEIDSNISDETDSKILSSGETSEQISEVSSDTVLTEVLPSETNMVPGIQSHPQHFVELSGVYYLESIEQDLKFASEYYTDITHLEVIGRTLEGRPIYAIRIGDKSLDKKPSILLMANLHAREDFSSMLSMKMLDYILYSYYDNGYFGHYNVRDLLSKIDIWLIPVANPDGLHITQNGIHFSSNYNELIKMDNLGGDDRWWKANANGVDLNRNFDDGNWTVKESTIQKSSEGYKGPYPNSEPETIAIQRFCNEQLPLMSISYHTSGEMMYWADSKTHLNYEGIDEEITERMADLTGYTVMPVSKDPRIYSSGFENWFRAKFNRLSICMELSPFPNKPFIQHDDKEFERLVWHKAKYTGLQLATEAIAYQDKMFEVYQLGNYVKTFYSLEKAKIYGQYFKDSYIINKGAIIE